MTTRKKKATTTPRSPASENTEAPTAAGDEAAGSAPDAPSAAHAAESASEAPESKELGRPGSEMNVQRSAPHAADAPARRRGAGALAVVSLIIALAAAAAAGYVWYQDRTVQSARVQALAERADTLTSRADQISGRVDAAQSSGSATSAAVTRMRERQSALEERVARLSEGPGRSLDEVALEEVRQLLLLANHRVRLAGDLDTAVAALKVADSRLEGLADPALLEVRERINEEIAALQTTPRPDIAGLALRLRGLANNVSALPLVTTRTRPDPSAAAIEDTAPPPGGRVRLILREIWHSLRNLVVVRQLAEPLPPLLPPEQEFFLRENLRLVLRGAELAALQGREDLYRAQLADARDWVARYFDGEKDVVRAALSEIDELADARLTASPSDIGGSLQAFEKALEAGAR
jgi:uncharacterized protein HemX